MRLKVRAIVSMPRSGIDLCDREQRQEDQYPK
jgi:hypothetical protein